MELTWYFNWGKNGGKSGWGWKKKLCNLVTNLYTLGCLVFWISQNQIWKTKIRYYNLSIDGIFFSKYWKLRTLATSEILIKVEWFAFQTVLVLLLFHQLRTYKFDINWDCLRILACMPRYINNLSQCQTAYWWPIRAVQNRSKYSKISEAYRVLNFQYFEKKIPLIERL